MTGKMDNLPRLSLYLVILVVAEQALSTNTLLNPFPLGTIGCLVSDVCDEGEMCKNDLLFGRCLSVISRPSMEGDVRYDLRTTQVARLDEEIRRLIKAGFTWRDAYTQCVLQNTLVEFAFSRSFNRYLCEETLSDDAWEDAAKEEVADVLLNILDHDEDAFLRETPRDNLLPRDAFSRDGARDAYGGDDSMGSYMGDEARGNQLADVTRDAYLRDLERDAYLGNQERDAYLGDEEAADNAYPTLNDIDTLNSNKRDEIVEIHKYFDKSKGQLKRSSYTDDGYNSLYNRLYAENNPSFFSDSSAYQPENNRLEDSRMMTYLPSRNDQHLSEDIRYSPEYMMAEQPELRPRYVPASIESEQQQLSSLLGQGFPYDRNQRRIDFETSDNLKQQDFVDDTIISQEDEAALMGLLDGSISPTDLDLAQQSRLAVIVASLIEVLKDGDLDLGTTTEALPEEDVPVAMPYSAPMFPAEEDAPALYPPAAQEYAMYGGYDGEPMPSNAGDARVMEELKELEELPRLPEPESLADTIADAEMTADMMEKKFVSDMEAAGGDNENVDAGPPLTSHKVTDNGRKSSMEVTRDDVFFVEVSKNVNKQQADAFVQNLTRSLQLHDKAVLEVKNITHNRDHSEPNNTIEIKVTPAVFGSEYSAVNIKNMADKKMEAEDAKNEPEVEFEKAWLITSDGTAVGVQPSHKYMVLTFSLVGTIAGVVLAVVTIYLVKRNYRSRQKLQAIATQADGGEASKDYQDLCRQRMQGKTSEKPEPLHASRIGSVSEAQVRSPSSRSSTSSWSEEPAATNMDISTGHIVLSYMEDHLKNQDRLDQEWEAVSGYVADPGLTEAALDNGNVRKSRFTDVLPYDHSRVILASSANVANSDYINASFITDHDPRNPAYICTQGPLPHTVADFWQMVWEQGSVVIVMLSKLVENGASLCHRYWPEEGSDLYHIYEVHLVSEHIWCDDYLVRSFYLKNLQTNETRTVTQFHFLTWPQLSVPASIKALLDFRRKVNKSFRGRSCPIVVHCSDGCGRSGTYCLIDMVLNKMAKGAKEIDMAATLEHIRDQRMSVVETKEQFQFSLAAVAEEVHAILKALPQ